MRKDQKTALVYLVLVFLLVTYALISKINLFENGIFDLSNPTSLIIVFSAVFMTVGFIFPKQIGKLIKSKPKNCRVCGKSGGDVLVVGGKISEKYYCRQHLLEKFKNLFCSNGFKMAVFHPEQKRDYCSTMYPYYPIDDMVLEFKFRQEEVDNIKKIMSQIGGKCTKCDKSKGQVAYFGKGILKWDGNGPLLKNIDTAAENLCLECVFNKIEAGLRNNREYFNDNGLIAPYGGSGVYVNTFL